MDRREIVLGIVEKDEKLLVIDIPIDDREFPGQVGFPGGDIRDMEDPSDGIKRLTEQETHVETEIKQKIAEIYQRIRDREHSERQVFIHVFELSVTHMPDQLPQRAVLVPVKHLDSLEMVPSNLAIFDTVYDRHNHGIYESILQRTEQGEYVQTKFKRVQDMNWDERPHRKSQSGV